MALPQSLLIILPVQALDFDMDVWTDFCSSVAVTRRYHTVGAFFAFTGAEIVADNSDLPDCSIAMADTQSIYFNISILRHSILCWTMSTDFYTTEHTRFFRKAVKPSD